MISRPPPGVAETATGGLCGQRVELALQHPFLW